MALANSGSTEEVSAAFFYGREDIIPDMFRRLLNKLYGAKHNDDRLRHFIYYIERHIELDGDSHGPIGRELLNDLIGNSPHREAQAWRAACSI
jgi:Protein of unknown function (DUF3050)